MLPEPATPAGRSGLTALLAEPARGVVAVDFDGTLAPIVPRPEDARPADGAIDALRVLAHRVGTVAVVTGRPAEVVVELGGLRDVARLVVLGHYGLQRWADGALTGPPPAPGVQVARDRLPDLLVAAPAGVTVEDKHHSLVVHTRQALDPAGALARLRQPLARLATDCGLELVPGRFVLELRPPGIDKGGGLRALVEERAAAAVVFVGDDLGDLPAYDAIEALRRDGVPGVTVCSSSEEVEALRERADLVLDGPAAVVQFLLALAAAIGD
jgi:trehalose 6-phosphate phosphatase